MPATRSRHVGPIALALCLAAPGVAHAGRVFYLNLDGGTLTDGPDSSASNSTGSASINGTYEPYGEGPLREAMLNAMAEIWAPFDVELVTERPSEPGYLMCTIGRRNGEAPMGALGLGVLDCEDAIPDQAACVAFFRNDDPMTGYQQARVISQEIAHTFGLVHTRDPEDIMLFGGNLPDGPVQFKDECIRITGDAKCPEQHLRHCPAQEQNPFAELAELINDPDLGTTGADTDGDGGTSDDGAPPTTSGTSADPTAGDTATIPTDSGGATGTGASDDGDGCGCRGRRADLAGAWAALVGALVWRRRR